MGETHTVRKFVEMTFSRAGMDLRWEGEGVNEKGYDKNTGKCLVELSEKYFRPAEVDLLLGDSTKARTVLGWKPSTSFEGLVDLMLENDMEMVKNNVVV